MKEKIQFNTEEALKEWFGNNSNRMKSSFFRKKDVESFPEIVDLWGKKKGVNYNSFKR